MRPRAHRFGGRVLACRKPRSLFQTPLYLYLVNRTTAIKTHEMEPLEIEQIVFVEAQRVAYDDFVPKLTVS
jgi:hypothetical protein